MENKQCFWKIQPLDFLSRFTMLISCSFQDNHVIPMMNQSPDKVSEHRTVEFALISQSVLHYHNNWQFPPRFVRDSFASDDRMLCGKFRKNWVVLNDCMAEENVHASCLLNRAFNQWRSMIDIMSLCVFLQCTKADPICCWACKWCRLTRAPAFSLVLKHTSDLFQQYECNHQVTITYFPDSLIFLTFESELWQYNKFGCRFSSSNEAAHYTTGFYNVKHLPAIDYIPVFIMDPQMFLKFMRMISLSRPQCMVHVSYRHHGSKIKFRVNFLIILMENAMKNNHSGKVVCIRCSICGIWLRKNSSSEVVSIWDFHWMTLGDQELRKY